MPHASLKVVSGVDQNRTPALNEAAISESQLIRFIPDQRGLGLPQKLGGWTKYFASAFASTPRCLWAWADLNSVNYLAVGAEASLSTISNGELDIITPQTLTDSSAVNFQTVAGSSSVLVTDTNGNSVTDYTSVFIQTPVSVGGLILLGIYQCTSFSVDAYTITATDTLGSPDPALWTTASQAITAVTPSSPSAGSVTIGFTGPYTFPVGSTITVAGVSIAGYNGTYIVTASTTTSVTYANSTTGAPTFSGATVSNYGAVPSFTSAAGTAQVTINLSTHKYTIGREFPIFVPVTVDGVTLPYGNYIVTSSDYVAGSTTNYSFTISAKAAASSAATTFMNSGLALFKYFIGNGPAPISITGYGSGYYGAGAYSIILPQTGDAVTGASGSGTAATVTFSGGATIAIGSQVYIAGIIDSTTRAAQIASSSISLTTLTVGTVTSGTIAVGQLLFGANVAANTTITANISGSGAGSTWTVSVSQTAASSTMYMTAPTSVSGYSGLYIVTASSAGSITYANATTATWVFGGYVGFVAAPPITGTPITTTDWTLDNYGSLLIAVPTSGPIYYYDPNSGVSTATVIPTAPSANAGAFVAMPERQIVAWGSTFDGIQDPLLIRYSDVNDLTSWIGTTINQAGSYRIPRGSKIVGAIQAQQQGLFWTDLALWSMQYVGPPLVYGFNEIGVGCGLIAPKAVAAMSGVTYWMGQSQFFRYAGGGVEPILCPVWDVIFQDLDTSNLDKIRVAPNSRFNEIAWYYPTTDVSNPIKYVKYNIGLNAWDFGVLSRTAWLNQSVLGPPIGAGPSNDANTNSYIYQHETSTNADGLPMLSSFQTGYFALDEADVKTFVDQVWPDMKWGYYNGAQTATVNITFFATDYAGQTPYQYGPFAVTQSTTYVTPRMRGRLVSIKIDSSDLDSFWRLGNIRYRLQTDGRF